ncbi:hypothetical protein IFM89_015748 [Coptis chinensis]|uniref:F-box domain-containing protein n=1 Tax=Coptis chinensis TaxID=261450 RepID=A0A835I3H0_9MAGN|nr:hypothetical protein IFM89_015748 [Coptis chinensis]
MVSNQRLDRISSLPKEVCNLVLESSQIRDAVKTSFLSKCWRYRWMSMHNLVFELKDTNLMNFVAKVLFLHNDVISKFEIRNFLDCGAVALMSINGCMLSRKTLSHLVLLFHRQKPPHQV